jgi:hypothetical protein
MKAKFYVLLTVVFLVLCIGLDYYKISGKYMIIKLKTPGNM